MSITAEHALGRLSRQTKNRFAGECQPYERRQDKRRQIIKLLKSRDFELAIFLAKLFARHSVISKTDFDLYVFTVENAQKSFDMCVN